MNILAFLFLKELEIVGLAVKCLSKLAHSVAHTRSVH